MRDVTSLGARTDGNVDADGVGLAQTSVDELSEPTLRPCSITGLRVRVDQDAVRNDGQRDARSLHLPCDGLRTRQVGTLCGSLKSVHPGVGRGVLAALGAELALRAEGTERGERGKAPAHLQRRERGYAPAEAPGVLPGLRLGCPGSLRRRPLARLALRLCSGGLNRPLLGLCVVEQDRQEQGDNGDFLQHPGAPPLALLHDREGLEECGLVITLVAVLGRPRG
mmetsp:Transcript_51030/g.163308  ORF Transcript_51030/g.163308 Transcript_51030/m.163308 type:complete len:224 (+) Transcript_51030:1983-2654(+)